MYNRYIPQPDGSFRRNRIKEPADMAAKHPVNCPPSVQLEQPVEQIPQVPPPIPTQHQHKKPCYVQHPPRRSNATPQCSPESITGFLKRLLPRNFDTADLMIVLLLLLMAGDCVEDQNYALLTLALYFFL